MVVCHGGDVVELKGYLTVVCRRWFRGGASSSMPHLTESSASKRLRLQFKSNIPDNTLYTMTKIEDQCALFEVELLDEFGRRVEHDLESPVKIKIDVLNGDFNVEENVNWTQKDYNDNIVKNRKHKGEVLKGDTNMTLSKGVVNLGHLCVTDNSSHMTDRTFRLGATAGGILSGVVIEAAVSQEFRVKERRGKSQGKIKKPSAEDALYCLVGIAKKGVIYNRACEAGIFTVQDFLQRLNSNAKELKNILKVPEANWNAIVKNAEACKLHKEANERPPSQISNQELAYKPYDIQQRQEQLQQPAPLLHPPAIPCSGDEYFDVGGFVHSSGQMCNISHTSTEEYLVSVSPTAADQGPMYGSSSQDSCELLEASPHYIEQWMQEYMLNNFPQGGERASVSEDLSHDHVTSKLLAVCYVTKAASLFMVSVQKNSSAPNKKRKLE